MKYMLFLEEVNSLSQRSILTFNSFHLVKAIRGGERTWYEIKKHNTKIP